MFQKKTVFVVGAGGSVDVGLPTGNTLKSLISEELNFVNNSGNQILRAKLEREKSSSELKEYFAAGRSISTSMALSDSIDNYLEAHFSNTKILELGKMGIAISISKAERESSIYTTSQEHGIFTNEKAINTWHNIFCRMAREGVQNDSISSLFNNVSIITFNYDRVVERYIPFDLMKYYDLSSEVAAEYASKLEIIHVYGQIGELNSHENSDEFLSYGGEINSQNIENISQQISVFTEKFKDETRLSRIRELLKEAEVVVFLGFSYAPTNMELLKLDGPGNGKKVFGTTQGMSASDRTLIDRYIEYCFQGAARKQTMFSDLDCSQFLSQVRRAILI